MQDENLDSMCYAVHDPSTGGEIAQIRNIVNKWGCKAKCVDC